MPRVKPRPFSPGLEWNMKVDLNRKLQFPTEIIIMSPRPDIVVWSTKARSVHIIELTVPQEERVKAAFEHKKAKYADLAAECQETGWRTNIFPVEVGCRGFVGLSTTRLLRETGVTGGKLKKNRQRRQKKAASSSG